MISFEASIRVRRPVDEVFDFVSDPSGFPVWNSAVVAVRSTSAEAGTPGSTYSMERRLAAGRVVNALEVFAHRRPGEFAIRTTSGPTPFVYRYRFASDGPSTVIRLSAQVVLPGVAGALGPLAARGVRRGVDANFAALRRTLEDPLRSAVR